MADDSTETTSADDLADDLTGPLNGDTAAEHPAEPPKSAEPKKPGKTAEPKKAARAGKPPKAPDGMPAAEGNRDDAAELDLGARGAAAGPPPDMLGADRPETAEETIARLERENADLRAGLRSLVPDEARRVLADPTGPAGAPPARAGAAAPVPGDGPVTWLGSIEGVQVIPPVRFRGSAVEAEAREQFLRHAGVVSTTGKVVVARQGD